VHRRLVWAFSEGAFSGAGNGECCARIDVAGTRAIGAACKSGATLADSCTDLTLNTTWIDYQGFFDLTRILQRPGLRQTSMQRSSGRK
jgi:hypothetical protein